MPLPCPALLWIRTRCPARVNSSTPTGIIATRYSSVLISLGTPTIMDGPRRMGSVGIVEEERGGNQGQFKRGKVEAKVVAASRETFGHGKGHGQETVAQRGVK